MIERIEQSAREVATPMTFSTLIIGVAFLPLFTMTGVSGVIFAPMARTYAFAIGGAIVLALTLTPVLASQLIPAHERGEGQPRDARCSPALYNPMFDWVVRHARLAALLALVPILAPVFLFPMLGREFMPKLEEGNFWIRATLPMSISLDQSAKYVGRMRAILRGCPAEEQAPCDEQHRTHPEVITVVSQLGRPDDGTDVSGFYNIELFAPLKPFDEWRRGVTKEKLTEELQRELEGAFPGARLQLLADDQRQRRGGGQRREGRELGQGLRQRSREQRADRATPSSTSMGQVPGIKDLGHFQSMGQPNIRITPKREVCARYGLNTGDVDAVIQAAIGGQAVVQVYEGEKHFDLTVRWKPQYRMSLEAIREITVSTPDGARCRSVSSRTSSWSTGRPSSTARTPSGTRR